MYSSLSFVSFRSDLNGQPIGKAARNPILVNHQDIVHPNGPCECNNTNKYRSRYMLLIRVPDTGGILDRWYQYRHIRRLEDLDELDVDENACVVSASKAGMYGDSASVSSEKESVIRPARGGKGGDKGKNGGRCCYICIRGKGIIRIIKDMSQHCCLNGNCLWPACCNGFRRRLLCSSERVFSQIPKQRLTD